MIMTMMHAPGISREQYEALRPVVQWEQNHPDGILLHACGFDEQGGMHVADVWESAEQMEAFFMTRLLPGMQAVGVNPPKPTIMPAHNVDAFPGIEKLTP
jgi:hypothetical protein